ncbi:MAG: LacI family DNA-binding transcriptional regulator [Rhodothermales bacterium]
MSHRPVRLIDIAKQLGISVSTVSRALHGYSDISAETKRAVVALADELQYRPNPIAQNLRNQESKILGVMIPEIVHHFFSSVIGGIMEVADQHGYTVMLCQSNEREAREKKDAAMLLNSRVDGVLVSLSDTTRSFEHLRAFIARDTPILMLDKVTDEVTASKVLIDDVQGGFLATEHLIQQGCSRVAHIRGPHGPVTTDGRMAGYRQALLKYGLPFDPNLVKTCERVTKEAGMVLMAELMQLDHPPDGLFAVTDLAAIGAMVHLKRLGCSIPDDVAIIGFSDWDMASIMEPPLSSVFQPGFEMGRMATTVLIDEIRAMRKEQPLPPQIRILNTQLRIRASSKRRRTNDLA